MAPIVDEIQALYGVYPPWLITTCLVIVGLGLGFVLFKLIRFGLVVVVALLLLAIAGFAGWMILAS